MIQAIARGESPRRSDGGDGGILACGLQQSRRSIMDAIAFAEPLARTIPQDYRMELMPRDFAEMLYPAPYRDALSAVHQGT